MKPFYLTTIIATILFICNNGIQAQTKPTSPANINQFELIKQLHNNLPPEIKQPFDVNKPQLPLGFENLQNPEILKTQKVNRLKSATADGQLLDSVFYESWINNQWVPFLKELYEYDKNGNIVLYTPYMWNGQDGNFWEPYPHKPWRKIGDKIEYQYDQNDHMISSIYYIYYQRQYFASYKDEYTYDDGGNITSIIKFWISYDGQVNYNTKSEYTYDTNNNRTLEASYSWNQTTSQWVGWNKYEYSFDANSNMTLAISYSWNQTTSQWVGGSKNEYSFDANSNMTLAISYSWDQTTSQWVGGSKNEYSFDDNNNMILAISYSWDQTTSQWVGGSKYEWSFDANNNKTLESSYSWDKTTSQWVGGSKTEWSFDANNNMNLCSYYSWDQTTSQWVVDYKYKYKFERSIDTNNNMPLSINYNWDQTTSKWVFASKNEWSFDANNNMTLAISYSWDQTTCQWIGVSKGKYSFDANSNKTQEATYSWDKTTSQWVGSSDRITWFYSDHTATFIPAKSLNKLTLYPNPAKDFVVFDLPNSSQSATVELYDIQGKKIIQQKLTETKQIAVGQLPKGLYLYRLTDSETFYSGKLLVE
jgi:hypothetical protein